MIDKMQMQNFTIQQIPWVQEHVLEEYADLVIKSNDGQDIKINHLLLVSCSEIAKRIIRDAARLGQKDDLIISSNLNYSDLKVFQDFIMRGNLPCPQESILNDELPPEVDAIFSCFGVDLSYLMRSHLIKVEMKEMIKPEDHHHMITDDVDNFGFDDYDKKPPYSIKDLIIRAIDHSPAKRLTTSEIIEHISENFPYYRKVKPNNWQANVRQKLNIHKTLFKKISNEESDSGVGHFWTLQDGIFVSEETDNGVVIVKKEEIPQENDFLNDYYMDNYNDYIEEDDDGDDGDYKPPTKKHKKSTKNNSSGTKRKYTKREKVVNNEDDNYEIKKENGASPTKSGLKYGGRPRETLKPGENVTTMLSNWTDKRIGIRKKIKKGSKEYQYCDYQSMLEYQERFKNVFKIEITGPDFTAEDYGNFVFQPPFEELETPQTIVRLRPASDDVKTTKCDVCKQKFESAEFLKQHFDTTHPTHYRCPFSNCGYEIQTSNNLEIVRFKMARHIHGHDHEHPQMSLPHECIACGYKTPYIGMVYGHITTKGPHHDNKCPKCEERFFSRIELQDHIRDSNHEGFRCGQCGVIFDNQAQKNEHAFELHGGRKPAEPKARTMCEDCGKWFSCPTSQRAHWRSTHDPNYVKTSHIEGKFSCDRCGEVCSTKEKLKYHINKHLKRPCTHCGKMLMMNKMKWHIDQYHTENHLKPHICPVCQKGFATRQHFDDHMNIHTGNKPYVCKYCGRGFADRGNHRMHERTAHEGHKRQK